MRLGLARRFNMPNGVSMTLKKILYAGAALCTISAAPAFARNAPSVAVVALHAGHAVMKTQMHTPGKNHISSTGSAFSTIAASKKTVKLIYTYYTYLSSGSFCNIQAKQKVKLSTKKTKYAKLGTSTESYSEGCGTPTVFYGDTYKLTAKKAPKNPDTFVSTLIGKGFHYEGEKYDGKLNLNVSVTVE